MPLRLVGVSSIATVNWSTWIAAGGAVATLALAVAAFWALKQNSVALAATRRDTEEGTRKVSRKQATSTIYEAGPSPGVGAKIAEEKDLNDRSSVTAF
jgi:hypothetical protein